MGILDPNAESASQRSGENDIEWAVPSLINEDRLQFHSRLF